MFSQIIRNTSQAVVSAFLFCNACLFDTHRFTTQEAAGSDVQSSAGSSSIASGGSVQKISGPLVSAGSSQTTTSAVAGRASASGGSIAINGGANVAGGAINMITVSGGATVVKASGGTTSTATTCFSADLTGIKLEADYILSSQIMPQDKADAGYGAIKHKPGKDNTIIPSEVAIAGIGLIQASKALNDPTYRDRAVLAANYLSRTIDKIYGGWFDQYIGGGIPVDQPISVRQTAMVVIFLHKLGYDGTRAVLMKSAGGFINSHLDLQNKKGADDGLICTGRDERGNFISDRWLSDNALAYHAMTISASWAETDGDMAFMTELRTNAAKILNSIKTHLYDSTKQSWIRMIKADGSIPSETASTIDWVTYSPALFELPSTSIPIANTGTLIHDTLQLSSGGVAWDNSNYRVRQSPMYSFQAALIWKRAGQCAFANSAMDWAKANTWRLTKDSNGLTGGWLDWIETSGNKPNELERSVETSAYAILSWTDFSFAP